MNMKKAVSILLACLLIWEIAPLSVGAKTENDGLKAKSAILMCMDTGDVIYAKNEYEHLSPASVTKIMTILLVLEALDDHRITLQDKVTASANAVAMGGSQIWLEQGEVMTVDELMKAVVISSANDACAALAEYVGGTLGAFVSLMNERAAQLGCKHTNFENCNGLDDTVTNHYSCAYDLALISCEVMKHKLIENYSTVWLDSLRNGKTELNNTNKLVSSFEGITGLKTGTTSKAGFCIAATARRDGMNLVAVVLGSETSKDRFDTASALLERGFGQYELVKLQVDEKKITPVSVKGGVFKEILPKTVNGREILIKKGNGNLKYKYTVISSVRAPIKKGDRLGKITVYSEENKVAEIQLVSPNDISRTQFKDIIHDILIKI